ncbi:MAG: hypothetical protein K6A74_07745 [Lachnospiraceae bacterium]|nr:hypothetical protein [Lachnospiraceae bacterium]
MNKVKRLCLALFSVSILFCACKESGTAGISPNSEEYKDVLAFLDYFLYPGLDPYDEECRGVAADFAVEKMLLEGSDDITYHESQGYYTVPADILKEYIDHYFCNSEKIIESIPWSESNYGEMIRSVDNVVFFEHSLPDYRQIHVDKMEKDGKYIYVHCSFENAANRSGELLAGVTYRPRVYVIEYDREGYKLLTVNGDI